MAQSAGRKFVLTIHIFKEGEVFVAHVPELDVSSCGDTADAARRNIQEALQGFLETSTEMGTLEEILHEAGFQHKEESWQPPEFVSLDRVTVSF